MTVVVRPARLAPKVKRVWPTLRRLEGQWVPVVERRIMREVTAWGREALGPEAMARLAFRDAAGTLERMRWEAFGARLTQALKPVLLLVVTAGARALGPEIRRVEKQDELLGALATDFQTINPHAVEYASQRVGELVTGITEETRAAIRAIIERGVRGNRTVDQMARDLRAVVGLNERQAVALANLRAGLEESGTSPTRIEELVARQAERALRQRAEMIARTETIAAANEGQRALWSDAVEAGLLSADDAQVWIASPDACPICLKIANGPAVPLGGDFSTARGAIKGPPAHPNCRCALGLQTTEVAA